MRKSLLLVAGVLLVGGTLTACIPSPPPPPPPRDEVLVVGDSIAFSFGCVLGDDGGSGNPCPSPGGFNTHSEIVGGCTISGGTVLLYNGLTTGTYGCGDWPTAWAALADEHAPEVVVIVTSGWEFLDRYSGSPSGVPDRQWGGQNFSAAASAYAANLSGAINLFRSRGAKVLVANSAYVNPPEPQFPPGTPGAPSFLVNAWYERYPVDNATPPPPLWQPPVAGLSYRPSKTKVEQYNQTITNTVSALGDSNVRVFDFFKHFSPGNAYSDYVCAPPNDSEVPNSSHNCTNGPAILARAPDGGHLVTTSPGGHDVLSYYLVPCVRGVLGVGGGDLTKCS